MDKYHSPSPLRLARDGSMEPLLRFDIAPEELVMLRDKKVLVVDDGQLKTIHGRKVSNYIRDIAHHGDSSKPEQRSHAWPSGYSDDGQGSCQHMDRRSWRVRCGSRHDLHGKQRWRQRRSRPVRGYVQPANCG